MTALAADRKSPQYGTPDGTIPLLLTLPVEAATTIFGGSLVAQNAAGNAVPASASSALKLWGRAEKQQANTGAAGAIYVTIKPGVYAFNNSTGADAIAAANVGSYCYAADDNTVALTDAGGTRPLAGVIYPFDPSNATAIQVGVGPGVNVSPYVVNPEIQTTSAQFRARNIVTTNIASLASYTVASASTNDNVLNIAGDVIILATQTTPAQNGPYVVGTPAAGVAPLVRPDWFPSAATVKSGVQIRVGGEGTVFKNTVWQAMVAADSFVVDTTDGKFYPLQVSGQTVLVAGTFTLSTVPIFSLKTSVELTRTVANTSSLTTGGYCATNGGANGITSGVVGTAAVIVQACVAAGTINNADISTINWTISNQPA